MHTDEEYARVQSLAQAMGISAPRLYERSLHAGDAVSAARLSSIIMDMQPVMRVMNRTAINLNQLAKVANATGEVEAAQVLAAAQHFDRQVERMRALLMQVKGGAAFDDDPTLAAPNAGDGKGAGEVGADIDGDA